MGVGSVIGESGCDRLPPCHRVEVNRWGMGGAGECLPLAWPRGFAVVGRCGVVVCRQVAVRGEWSVDGLAWLVGSVGVRGLVVGRRVRRLVRSGCCL